MLDLHVRRLSSLPMVVCSRWSALVCATTLLAASGTARAAIFTVGSTLDGVDAAIGDGACATAGGVCTLRAAIQEANAFANVDTVNLPTGTCALTINGAGEDAAATGDLDILNPVNIVGAGAAFTKVDASSLSPRDRVFHVIGTGAGMRDFTITGGQATVGGGILKSGSGTLDLLRMSIEFNEATADGGGVYNTGPSAVQIDASDVHSNMAGANGGGIFNDDGFGVINIVNGTAVSDNFAVDAGGGIYNGFTGDVTIEDSTIEDNDTAASGQGGGVASFDGLVTLTGSDVLRNEAGAGGGLYFDGIGGDEVTISGCLFESNVATDTVDGGGGAFIDTGYFTIEDSEFASNTATDGEGGGLLIVVDQNGALGQHILDRVLVHDNTAPFGNGGGIKWVLLAAASARIEDSAVYANSAVDGGGMYALLLEDADLSFVYNTISSNTAVQFGGGMWVDAKAGAVAWMGHLTVASNIAGQQGGGLYAWIGTGSLPIRSSILADNEATSGTGPDCMADTATFTSLGNNIVMDSCGDGTECPGFKLFGILSNGDQVGGVEPNPGIPATWECPGNGVPPDYLTSAHGENDMLADPQLGPLQDNGGSTMTHEIPDEVVFMGGGLPGQAHNWGGGCGPTDQRQMTSPVGDCDVGAFERQ